MKFSLSPDDHARIKAAVAEAESGTDGEIVTIIARRSDDYHEFAVSLAALTSALVLVIFVLCPGLLEHLAAFTTHGWAAPFARTLMVQAVLAIGAGLLVLALLAIPRLRVTLCPPVLRRARVRARAIDLFKVGAEAQTARRTGVLVYLSLAERCAEIVTDRALHGKVSPEIWGMAMAGLITEIRAGRLADGMVAAIGEIGQVLHTHLPRRADDINELPDRVIEL